jgi:tRNA U34 5-methylaminomethyl-2-thiouridine-forming methyltransferase MnmC
MAINIGFMWVEVGRGVSANSLFLAIQKKHRQQTPETAKVKIHFVSLKIFNFFDDEMRAMLKTYDVDGLVTEYHNVFLILKRYKS